MLCSGQIRWFTGRNRQCTCTSKGVRIIIICISLPLMNFNCINYPPLYTLQPAKRLRDIQIRKWEKHIMEAAHSKVTKLSMNSDVFVNEQINRTADEKLKKEIF